MCFLYMENIHHTENKYTEEGSKIVDKFVENKYFFEEDILKSKKKLQLTNKGLYSISKPQDAMFITNTLIQVLRNSIKKDPSKLILMDSTAGMGGNTIHFSKFFRKVISIDIDSTHFNVLKNNVESLSLKNIELCHDTFVNHMDKKIDVLFFDPPWGGNSYKKFKYFNLTFQHQPIHQILNDMHAKKIPVVMFKAPINLNVNPIVENVNYEHLHICKNPKKTMLLLLFYGL